MNELRVLDLFSGIGGFSLGLERTGGFRTVAFCEIEPFCQRVLRKHWPDVPIYDDVRELTAERLRADGIAVDVVTGGFPCQDLSVAGRRAGIEGERSGLWTDLCRIIGDVRPRYAIVENVSNLLSGPSEQRGGWFGRVLGDLAEIGFDAEWHCIPASAVGAPHIKDRVWIIASDASCEIRERRFELFLGRRLTRTVEAAAVVADDYCQRELQSGWVFRDQRGRTLHSPECFWSEAWNEKLQQLRSMDDGFPDELAAVHAAFGLGNAVVPQIPELIGRAILEAEGR